MQLFILEDTDDREITWIDAVNEPKARLDLGDKWYLARVVPHAEAQGLFDETVIEAHAALLNRQPNATKLIARRGMLAQIVARLR